MTDSAEEAVVRARLLLELASDLPKENLSAEVRALLESPELLEGCSDRVERPDGCEPDDLAPVEQPGRCPNLGGEMAAAMGFVLSYSYPSLLKTMGATFDLTPSQTYFQI